LKQTTRNSKRDQIVRLEEEQRMLRARLRRLSALTPLSSAEQVEVSQLRQLSLSTDDRLRSLTAQ